ncbi:hypothetical protein AAFC00_002988 [Neodothiora populina]|uniref:Beta-glucuronidase C-terminal domain-containing protein n=1 Tax=Neodothiora populina TaxID=2781224 RepID=A0ABR3PA83_9PEZI
MYTYSNIRCATVFVATTLFSSTLAQDAVSVTPAAKAAQASGLSQQLSRSYAGMGIEPSNLFSFTGGDEPNQLSINLLQNLANYSGAPPHLRIGGNTGDYMIYNASYKGFDLHQNQYSTSQGGMSSNQYIFGPDYLKALDRFPTDTPITYGLNLAYEGADYADIIAAEAAGVLDELNNTKVVSFEIGNEPDLYLENWDSLRTGQWDGTTYTQQFLDRAGIVYRRVLQPRGMPSTFFETASTASTISTTFTVQDLIDAGMTAAVNGSKFISSWNQHDYFYFISVSTYPLTLEAMMNLDQTVSQFKYWASEVATSLKTGLPYNLREMQSVGPTGQDGVSNTFGAALWQLNFFFYAASLNISSVQMHMTDNSFSAPWQPGNMNNVGPNIRPTYYAYAAFAQLLGAGNGTTQIAPLSLSSAMPNVRAYAAYEQGSLTSVVLINANQANASSTSKANLTFAVDFSAFAGQKVFLSYLTADGADVKSNATWNGISFEQDSVGTPSTSEQSAQGIDIDSNGIATIPVRDSQAVIARIGSALGSSDETTTPTSSSGSSTTPAGSSGTSSASASAAAASATKASGSIASSSASLLMISLALMFCFFMGH